MRKTHRIAVSFVALVAALGGCTRPAPEPPIDSTVATPRHPPSATELSALARLEPTQGNNVRGTVRFRSVPEGVQVTAEITGLTPGEHGFHIHEIGDCSAPDATSAGGHFNPTNRPHAGRDAEQRHVGDLGNLSADQSGRAELNYVDRHLALAGPNSIVGRAVIVHAGRDDLSSQPAGDSGPRVACGVIELERKNF